MADDVVGVRVKRTPMRRTTPLRANPNGGTWGYRSRAPLPKRSKRTMDTAGLRATVRWEVLERDAHRCRAPAAFAAAGMDDPGPCAGRLDVHERIRRSAWRDAHLVAANCLTVCRFHHDWIGLHPLDAIEAGLAAPSTAHRPTDPPTTPQENP